MPFTKGGFLTNKEYKPKPKFTGRPTKIEPMELQRGPASTYPKATKPNVPKRMGIVKSLMGK